jgi:predicted ATPase
MIHRLTVRNFKSIEDVSVDLGDVTVLVGRSGTGKTNFVTALRFLRDFLHFGPRGLKKYGDWRLLLPATQQKCTMAFQAHFEVRGVGAPFTYELVLSESGPQAPVDVEALSLGNEVLFHQRNRKWVSEPEVVPVPGPGAPAVGRIPGISEIVIAYSALTSGIGCYDFPATVLGTPRGGEGGISGLHDDATNYLQVLQQIASNLQDLSIRPSITASLQCLNPTVSAVELDSIQQPQKIVVGHAFDHKTLMLNLSQESDGFRRFYAHMLALYQMPPKQTLIFEEPENGIHPGALELLANEFKAAPRAGRGQVILTTHSPRLLDHFAADEIRAVVLDGLRTRVGKISKEQQQAIKGQLLDAGELLTVDPARIDEPEPGAE